MAVQPIAADPNARNVPAAPAAGMKKVAIVQSNYIPWKGYFDLIDRVDEFILYDDVQYTRRDWRNRNRIKTPKGPRWLTIPVQVKGRFLQTVNHTVIADPRWNRNHWRTIVHNYARAPYFSEYRPMLEELYLGAEDLLLSTVNHRFIRAICTLLGISTRISRSADFQLVDGRTQRLLSLCKQAGATEYISGPAAQSYLDETIFRQEGINVRWMDYGPYPEYPQLYPPFEHRVSILDVILNNGEEACRFALRQPGTIDQPDAAQSAGPVNTNAPLTAAG